MKEIQVGVFTSNKGFSIIGRATTIQGAKTLASSFIDKSISRRPMQYYAMENEEVCGTIII